MSAPAAPVVPEIPLAVIGIGLVCTYIAVLGLKKAYPYTLGALLSALANNLRIDSWKIHINLGGVFDKLNDKLEAALAGALFATETAFGKWWYAQKKLAEWTYDSLVWSMQQVEGAFTNLVGGTIPDSINIVLKPVKTDLGSLRRAVRAEFARLEVQLVHKAQALSAQLEQDFGRAWRGIDALRRELPLMIDRAVHGLEADVAALERAAHGWIPRRLSRLETLLGAGVLSGIAIAALTKVFGFWQCGNVRRLARGTCRMNPDMLDALLAGTLIVAGSISLVELARDCGKVLPYVANGTAGFVRETRDTWVEIG